MGKFLTSVAPMGADLARIEHRKAELVAAMRPTSPDLIVPRIARLFLRFPSAKIENPAGTTAAYASDLASFPLWAIEAGIMALLKGHGLESKSFAPSSIIVRDAVVREIARVEAELSMINRVLNAKPKLPPAPDAARKARALAEALDFIGGARANQDRKRGGMTPEQVAAAHIVSDALRTGRPDPRPIPPLSPYLRAKLRLPDVDIVPDASITPTESTP